MLAGSNTTALSGSIITEGNNARGIVNSGTGNVTTITKTGTKTGTIKTTGNGSTGIRQTYGEETLTENILTVEGSISTEGKNARAISNETNGNKTTVSGIISTKGEIAYGIYNFGDSNTTTISAGTLVGSNITTSGAGAHGIYNEGQSNVTTIELVAALQPLALAHLALPTLVTAIRQMWRVALPRKARRPTVFTTLETAIRRLSLVAS